MKEKFYKNRRLWRFIGGVAGGLAVVVVCVLLFFPTAYVLGKVTGAVSGKLGRDFSIDGPSGISWNWVYPHIHAEKIRIANMPGGTAPDMVTIEQLDMDVNIWKLLVGRMVIPQITVVRPVLSFEKLDANNANWDFPALSTANTVKNAALPHERGDFPLIGALHIAEGKITYRDVPRKLDMTLDMDTARGHESHGSEGFSFKGTGTLEDRTFSLTAEGGSLEMLRDSSKEYPLKLDIEIGATKFGIDGTFVDPVQLKGLSANMHLSGNNLADLFFLMHIPFPPSPAYKLEGHLAKEDTKWDFSPFSGTVGGSDLSGDVSYNTLQERPSLTGKLLSNNMDVKDLGGLIGLAPSTRKKTEGSGKLLPDVPIDLTRLRAGDMDLQLEARKLVIPGVPVTDMSTHIDLRQGMLDFKPVSLGVAGGRVEGAIRFDGTKDIPGVTMDLDLKKLGLQPFFKGSSFDALSKGHFGGHVDLIGSGKSLADVLAVSNGRLVIVMSGGDISLKLVEAADLDIAQLTPLILGTDETTGIRCGVADFGVTDGLLASRIFILDTDDTNLKGKMKINLKDESIDATLNARPKDSSLLSLQSDILVKGKMKSPSVMLDPVSTGARGASAVLLGLVNPLAAILPFIEVGVGKDSDCGKLIESTEEPLPKTKDKEK